MQPVQIRRIREDVKDRYRFEAPIDLPKAWGDAGLRLHGQYRGRKFLARADDADIVFSNTVYSDVTALYRYQKLFEFVAKEQLSRNTQPRILSAPASLGCEAYSLSSIFGYQAHGQGRAPAVIHGVDICESKLQAARSGVYPASFAANIPMDYAGFYHLKDDELIVAEHGMRGVDFLPSMDLSAKDALGDEVYTASICLNLMMYLNREQNAQLLDNLIRATAQMIVIGHGSSQARFNMVREKMQASGFVRDRRRHGFSLGTYDVYMREGPHAP